MVRADAVVPEGLEDLFCVGRDRAVNLVKDRAKVAGRLPDLRDMVHASMLRYCLKSLSCCFSACLHGCLTNSAASWVACFSGTVESLPPGMDCSERVQLVRLALRFSPLAITRSRRPPPTWQVLRFICACMKLAIEAFRVCGAIGSVSPVQLCQLLPVPYKPNS